VFSGRLKKKAAEVGRGKGGLNRRGEAGGNLGGKSKGDSGESSFLVVQMKKGGEGKGKLN